MTVLDQPIAGEEQPAPVKRGWTWFERMLPGSVILITIIREIFGWLLAYEIILFLASLLGVSYLLAFYWIAKPPSRNLQTVLVTLLYGFAFFWARSHSYS